MLKIKDGKFYGTNYSFSLPEGFNLLIKSYPGSEMLEFVSDDQVMKIEIYFVDDCHCAKEDLQDVVDDSDYVQMGDFTSVKRGNGTGVGLFYKSEYGNSEHYEERYDFKKNKYGETQLDIDIYLWSGRKKLKRTIYETLELPSVKAFLESVEYF